jgi:2-dehydropantoate 2-reductase
VQEEQWPRIVVMGAGAVGCYFGGMLARAGAPVTMIGRQQHVEAMNRNGLFLDSIQFQEQIPISATTHVEAVRDSEIVLVCVKTLDTEEAAKSLEPYLGTSAVVVSLQNGVDNVERIRAATKVDAIPAVVYVAAAMTALGRVKHTGRGDLIIGNLSSRDQSNEHRQHELEKLAAVFTRAAIPCRISENIEGELWLKLIINCAYNAISALSRARYNRLVSNSWTRELMKKVVEECLAVANTAGVQMPNVELLDTTWKLAGAMPEATSSTEQDIARGRRTEIDSLNGYIVRRGAELGVETPLNQTLHALVKLLEETL